MQCHASNIYLATKKIKLHANQQKILLEKELNVESLNRKDSMSVFEERIQCCIFNSVYILGKGLNVVSLLEKGLNVVSLFEKRTQCRISI